MKLLRFEVKNYRSIGKAVIELGRLTVLVGPNNEGKSNLLQAIVTALNFFLRPRLLLRRPGTTILRREPGTRIKYDYETDYPIHLRALNKSEPSEFTLTFDLSKREANLFAKQFRILPTFSKLSIRISCDAQNESFTILSPHIPSKQSSVWYDNLRSFLKKGILLQYIPTLRPPELAIDVVDELVARELAILESNKEYQELTAKIHRVQLPILNNIARDITETISSFIPEVKKIRLGSQQQLRTALRRSSELLIDDGTETLLNFKGEGVKSLAAIALLKYISTKRLTRESLLLLIEEPESHLHPNAIHQLRATLQTISGTSQVIISTHAPVLINRELPATNIIVKTGEAHAARNIAEIRNCFTPVR